MMVSYFSYGIENVPLFYTW